MTSSSSSSSAPATSSMIKSSSDRVSKTQISGALSLFRSGTKPGQASRRKKSCPRSSPLHRKSRAPRGTFVWASTIVLRSATVSLSSHCTSKDLMPGWFTHILRPALKMPSSPVDVASKAAAGLRASSVSAGAAGAAGAGGMDAETAETSARSPSRPLALLRQLPCDLAPAIQHEHHSHRVAARATSPSTASGKLRPPRLVRPASRNRPPVLQAIPPQAGGVAGRHEDAHTRRAGS
mmetsp:Transcript_81582/g.174835  ORF Transcript_81582/g.174835 Transcript_81582/m.174835 type:complete len:236 (+) Transcript_81582:495-1202(+)